MRNWKIALILVLFIGVCLGGIYFFNDYLTTRTDSPRRDITNLENDYNADGEIANALERLKSGQEKVPVITGGGGRRVIALTFDGLTDRTTVQRILDLLKKYDAKATFFVDGIQTAEDPQTVVNIRSAGQKIENYTLSGRPKMETLPADRLVKDFCRAQKIIKVNTDKGPNLLKCNDTKYTDQLLRVAKACGFNAVVKSDVYLNAKNMKSLKAADEFVRAIKPGSIVSVKLKADTDPIVKEPGKTDDRPAIDKQPGLKDLSKQVVLEERDVVDAVERLLVALAAAKYDTVYVEDLPQPAKAAKPPRTSFRQNDGASFLAKAASLVLERVAALFTCRTAYAAEAGPDKAREIKFIPTTEPAVAFTFGGLSKEAVVDDVLQRLNNLGIKATFFVAETEMRRYPETVRRIIANGHEIGISIRPKKGETFAETCQNITRSRKLLRERFGVTTNLVKQPWGAVTDTTKEAAAALHCRLIGQSINVVQSRHKDYTSVDRVIAEIFSKYLISLARGDILFFRMDFYTNERLVGELLAEIKRRKVDNVAYAPSFDNPANNPANDSAYAIKPVGEILKDRQYLYRYPVNPDDVPASLRSDGPTFKIDGRNFLAEASKRFIGNEEVTYEDRMLGFSKMDDRRLDKTGLIHTNDNVIFLTFDDWGTDAAINKLLYVLRKHNVSATFFVITHNIFYNPNLLRTIVMEGHNVASHSDNHRAMVVRDPQTGKEMATQTKDEYVKELALSFRKLRDVVGDVTIGGKPALTRFFRPPTLAISRMGLESLFEDGYEYIICGSSSTYDYKAQSVSELVRTMIDSLYTKDGELKKGAILIMHMGDSEVYTAMALDILLTANEAKADSDPTKFRVGRLADYLPEGYSQIDRKKSLRLNSHDKVRE